MFNEISGLIQSFTGGDADPQAVASAAEEHVGSMDSDELSDHIQNAADTARANGNDDVAQQLEGMVSSGNVDPDQLKSMAVNYIKNNPEVLQHFAPSFAQGIISKFTG